MTDPDTIEQRLLGLHHREGPPTIYGEAADLIATLRAERDAAREALSDLETACDNLAATRSSETYNSMIHRDDAHNQLIALDACRLNARAALAQGEGR